MKNKFSKVNQPVKCRLCDKLTVSSIDLDLDIQLCRTCYDLVNLENEHNDRHVDPKGGCIFCEQKQGVKHE